MISIRPILLALIAVLVINAMSVSAHAQQSAEEEIRQLLEQRDQEIKSILNSGSDYTSEQREQLRDLITNIWDFQTLSATVLGPHWDTLSTDQRTEFETVFRDVVRMQSLDDLSIYEAPVTIEQISVQSDSAYVRTVAEQQDTDTLVEYIMNRNENREDEMWKAEDIIVDGVSTAEGYARSFQSIMRREGFKALIATLEGVLPVELVAFSAQVNGSEVELTWQTATEVNNAGFAIEHRSETGKWSQLGFVEGNGTTEQAQFYRFIDDTPSFAAVLFYRLRQVDFDGSTEYSPVVKVRLAPSEVALLPSAPNPFFQSTRLRYELPQASAVSLQVYDLLGRHIATLVNREQSAGRYEQTLDGARLASGTYLVRLQAEEIVRTQMVHLVR